MPASTVQALHAHPSQTWALGISVWVDVHPSPSSWELTCTVAADHGGDLVLPAGVTMVTDPEYGIASVMITRASLSADEAVAEGEEGAAEGGEAPAAAESAEPEGE